MKKFRFGFAIRSAIVSALIVLLVVFAVIHYVLDTFYAKFEENLKNVVDSVNEGARNDIFGRMVSSIKAYGDYIIQNRVDEYSFFKNVIEKSLYQQTDAYSIVKTNEQNFILSCFYYDGEKFYSRDSSFSEDLELTFALKDMIKSKKLTDDLFFSIGKRGFVYFYILNKGVIGAKFYPGVFNRSFLESIFGKLPFFYAVRVKGKEDKYYSDTGFVVRAMEYMPNVDINQAHSQLSSRMGDKFGVEYSVFGGDVVFYIKKDYISFIHEQLIIVPLASIFPMSEVQLSLIGSLPIVILVVALMLFINSRVLGRITYLSERIAELGRSGGDLSYRVEARTNISEVREVAENINDFLDAVEEIVKKSKSTFRDVEQNIQILSELGEEVVKVSEVVSRQDEVRQMIEEINAMSGEVGTTVEEMLRSIETIRNNVEKQYAMMEEMSGMVEETIMTVSNVGRRIERANELLSNLRDEALRSSGSVRKNVEEVRDVNMFLGNVLEVVDVIKGISDRIEVLSMNAGIEAAHAGEAGRGFAVVAEEMGNLAEDSRKKAGEVERIVRDVIERVKGSVEGVEENGERFVRIADGIREVSAFVGEINASMVEVVRTNEMVMGVISNLTSYSEGIRVAVEEGKTGMEEVVRAVYEVSDATGNLSERFGEVYGVMRGAVEVLRGASERLPLVVESLKALGEELNKFKVKEVKLTKGITLVE